MPIPSSQIAVCGYYITDTDQLRKIDEITKDAKKRQRISYSAKSAKYKNRAFVAMGTKANPALETTFANACSKRLSASEIATLRNKGVLLPGE
ncbi:MAG: hypothetical protein WBE44_13350 [Terriglobales bacterium]